MSLPPGWADAALCDVAKINPPNPDGVPSDDTLVSFVPMALVEELSGRLDPRTHRRWRDVKKGFSRFQEGDVVIAKITPSMENGKAAIAQGLANGVGAGTTELHVLRPRDGVEARYLLHYILQEGFRRRARGRMTGTAGQLRVPTAFLEEQRIPLAPAAEQSRIVETLDSLLSRLDAAVVNLELARTKLKAYRASVLKAAVEGRLVPTDAELARTERRSYEPADVLLKRILEERRRQWEDAELAKMKAAGKTPKDNRWKDKYSEPTLDKRELPSLPEGWQWARLDQVSEVQLGQQRAPVHAAASDQLPYVRAANITWDGLDLGDVKTMGFPNPERYRLKFGDVLLSEASGSPMQAGKPAVWRDEIPDACYQKTLIRVRTFEPDSLLPTYLRLVFLRDCLTGKFARLAPGVGIVHLTAERMLPWAVPVPPRTEQQRIVDEVERLETVQNSVSAAIARERTRIVRLRQAILTWAFDGRLVEQIPGDEPAESLLGRIRAEPAIKTPTTPEARRARKLRAAS